MARMRLSAEIELYALIWESSRKWKLYNHEWEWVANQSRPKHHLFTMKT
jgi:hypothetical protein